MTAYPQNSPRNLKGETPEIEAAFNRYLKLGHKRSLNKLANEIGESLGKVTDWSKKFNWQERITELQKEALEDMKEKTKHEFFKESKNLIGYKFELLALLKEKVNTSRFCSSCESNPASISEIIKVLEVVKTELGEPTTIASGSYTVDKGNPFAGIFNSFFGNKDEPDTEAN